MEFPAMKRRDLLELCRQYGIGTRGSKADLAASLAGAFSGAAAAAAAESVVEVVLGKGCLKRLGGSASGRTSGAAKKVRFASDKESEERARQTSQVIFQPVVTKTRGRRKARKVHPAVAVSRRGCRWECDDVGGDSADEDVTGEVGADAPVMRSTMKAVCLCAQSGSERNNPAEAEQEGEVVEAAIDTKRKQKIHENAEVIAANAQAGISHKIARSPCSSSAALLLSPFVEKKKGRRKARDGMDELGVEEQTAEVQDLTTTTSLVIINSRSCRKGEDCIPFAQKPTKVVVSRRTTRSNSLAATVILPTNIGNKLRKTRGTPKTEEPLPTTVVSRRGRRQKCDAGGDSVDHGAFGEVGADSPVAQCRTEAVKLCAESGVEGQNNPAEAEEEGQVVGAAVDSRKQKRKRKAQENAEGIAANAQADELLSNANCRLPVAKDLKIVHPLTLNTAITSVDDVVLKAEKELGFTKRSSKDKRARNAGGVSFSGDNGNKSSTAKMELGVLDERTTGMHESVSGEVFQSAKGGDMGRQPAVPVRRSTRRCVVAGRI
ncbi:hypothetical protein BAE44_0009747 [Dichanthelium oligosanthes]|uniref:SAP domain-containing protein n=1 Tax=Dichanthelium oligosanthes TaxID=888268 RepID=A0A1E5VVW1_9POAL|nr:hypothetical protein BAE44_0009747 [Dichanthelium oligosanthes]